VRQLSGKDIRTIRLRARRFDPASQAFQSTEYEVQADHFTSVLDLLLAVKERQDPTLSFRYSCNMGICGSCGMVINGQPRLACETNVFSLRSPSITVAPMEAHPILRDLVTDFDDFFAKHASLTPWLVRRDQEEKFRAEKEYPQTRRQVDNYLNFAHCISCGLCVDACPVNNTNPHFAGPQALSQAYRYNSDSRDQGERDRLEKMDTMDGVWGCEYAGACSKVCPKGVDPALTIQRLKLELMRYRLTGGTAKDKQTE
jgi:succinate dehydrogenase / fumarate reductase iron-sulfur subunit